MLTVPSTLIRIWDIFLLEGSKCLFRFAMALLKRNEEMLLQQTDTISFWKCLKAASRITYDADSLVQTAYEELKPFVSRNTILSLQSHHYEILNKEMTEKQRLWQKVFKEVSEEHMEEPTVVMRRRKCNTDRVCVQAATSFKDEQMWICYGGKFHSQLVQVRVNDNRMAQVGFELDTRVSCIRALNNEILLLGMMSDKLCAYSIETKEILWQLPLHDIITDIVVADWPHEHMNRVFAGLGNGELLVIENANMNEPKDSMFVFTIGFTRVSSLLLMDNQLWCACSHSVYVFNTATLDYQLHFNISDNALDLISTMKSSVYGCGIAVRGSPVIELWDPKTYNRLLLFNTCTDAYLDYREWPKYLKARLGIQNAVTDLSATDSCNRLTLDYQLHFNISDNALDLISTMKSSVYGVWIAVRGSPVIELWDPKTYNRLLLFNTCTDAYLDYREVSNFTEMTEESFTSSNSGDYIVDIDLADPQTGSTVPAQSSLESTLYTYSSDILLQNVMQHLDDCISDSPEQLTSPAYQDSDPQSPRQETNEMNGQAESIDFAGKDEASLSRSNQSLSNIDQNGSRDFTKSSLTASVKSESVASSPSNYFHDFQSTGSDDYSPVLPVPNPMFCPLRRHSRLIESKTDQKLPRLQLQPMLRNKVSETPIRLFVTQRCKDGERVIISCATYFNDDDAVLKWHRCKTEVSKRITICVSS
ncbi:hypothetical protein AHF37_01010 [Paragonimus kellicotti]|nr:hypothetical protein AHF37_01010 [Paragonimus kellicotti]